MKVLVTGSTGLLGHDVWKLFERKHELVALGRRMAPWVGEERFRACDLTNAALTYSIITKENPDLVVHCAAFNNVDGAETDQDSAFKGNSLATRNVALGCQRFDATLISISTDYVFDGESSGPSGYKEYDPCRPINHYGKSKLWGEEFVKELLSHYFIVRTSWLFGPTRDSWIDSVVHKARAGEPILAAADMRSAPTFTADLADSLLRLAESRHYGVYHLTNEGFCTRTELAEEVLSINQLNRSQLIRSLPLKELKLTAPRPHFSGLDNYAWRLDGFPPMRSWKEALRDHFARKKVAAS